MTNVNHMEQANQILRSAQNTTLSTDERCQRAIALAALMLEQANATQTHAEKQSRNQFARMLNDPQGKEFLTSLTDQCFRTHIPTRTADQMVYLLHKFGIPQFLPLTKRLQLLAFKYLGKPFAVALVPFSQRMIRQETAQVIVPTEKLSQYLKKRREENIHINLNHLGEAILGEEEALQRLKIYLDDLANPDIEYISIKISTICSQLNLLSWDATLKILTDRLRQLYRAARDNRYTLPNGTQIPKFVNLDMEEYRDLHLTVEAFKSVLNEPEFLTFKAGIVLQSYLPDSYAIQQELTLWAKDCVERGGAAIKIRIVKGANLAMEKVESSLRGWPQAPYLDKLETDANFKRMVQYGCKLGNAKAAHLGIGSHNLFDIAYAMLLRAENRLEEYISFEMLEGMAEPLRRVVQSLTGEMLLYSPTTSESEFQNAVAYLVRRLDENTAEENFLRHFFEMQPGSQAWNNQAQLFELACKMIPEIGKPRRTQNRFENHLKLSLNTPFTNEPDTDWSLPENRHWAEGIVNIGSNQKLDPVPLVIGGKRVFSNKTEKGEDPSKPDKELYRYSLANETHIDQALKSAEEVYPNWSQTNLAQRSLLLATVAQKLRMHRDALIGAMIADTGKTIPEADVEVSEAIDFAEYYRLNIEEILSLKDLQWSAKGTVLVAPPWNFPCSIPAGGILAALATGNCVIFKPASEAVYVGWVLVQIFWEAGISPHVLQFITCDDDPVGSLLVQDPRISCVLLTGATATAKHLLKLRPGMDLIAETGGKNAIILSNLCDRDLAIKDVIQSAFGHAGQKCSACSLVICEAEVYDDPHFRKQLKDAAASLSVGSAWDLATRINPLIHFPNSTLLRALNTLEPVEEWLLRPQSHPENPQLWSPGIKLHVQPGSFTHQTELFGPVLGMMRANNLSHAIELANGTPYGLTSGLHSLDEREHSFWKSRIEAGNLYINRGITGAIVRRQPFGGCKDSSFGAGVKAGGPNYLIYLMQPKQIALPEAEVKVNIPDKYQTLKALIKDSEQLLWTASLESYLFFWTYYFSQSHDPSCLLGEDNLLQYVPRRQLLLRLEADVDPIDILRALVAADICGADLEISGERRTLSEIANAKWIKEFPRVKIVKETERRLISRIKQGKIKRVRLLKEAGAELKLALSESACSVQVSSLLANGRIELLHYLREVSISYDYHRYGYVSKKKK